MFEKVDSSNRQKMNGCSFQQVWWLNLSWFLSYHRNILFLRGFVLKLTERPWVLLISGTIIFKIALRLPMHDFVWQSLEILNVFNNVKCPFTLKLIFWKTKTIFTKKIEYCFLVEGTIFPYKTALSEANFKTNIIGGTKWTYF